MAKKMRKVFVLVVCVLLVVFSTGCSLDELLGGGTGEEYAYEGTAVKYTSDTTYYNTYLGVSYTVPTGWWLYEINEDNFSEVADSTSNEGVLDISANGDYYYMDLISCANLQYSNKDNHVGVDLSVEKVSGIATLDEYMLDYEEWMLEPLADGSAYTLVESDQDTIGGVTYEKRLFSVPQGDSPYYVSTWTCGVKEGYFLTIYVNYWPENDTAESTVKNLLETNLTIS